MKPGAGGGYVSRRLSASMRYITGVVAVALLLSACKAKQQASSNLRARIIAAGTSQYCHLPGECFNPHILVVEAEYDVTTFIGNRPHIARVPPQALRDYLLAIPMSAWPQGPMIGITPSDDVIDWPSIRRNLEEAQRICRSLGLDVQFRPGG